MKNSILGLILYVIVLPYNANGIVCRKLENGVGFLNFGEFRKN